MQLTERDRTIIRTVYRHRFLRSSQVVALLGGNPQPILRRLQLLFHHGYLERPRSQIDYYHQGGSRQMVYGLADRGGALLKRELGDAFTAPRSSEKNRSVLRVYLEHALLVSDVMVTLELACRRTDHIRLLTEDELLSPSKKVPRFKWNIEIASGLRLGVIPDRVFALESKDPAGNASRAYFFLEADRGTMPVKRRTLSQTSFFRKLLAYEATWSQSIHQTRFGFHRFRVLTVTTTAARVASLIESCSQLKSGHGLFLFTDAEIFRDHADVFTLAWNTGRQGETSTLLG